MASLLGALEEPASERPLQDPAMPECGTDIFDGGCQADEGECHWYKKKAKFPASMELENFDAIIPAVHNDKYTDKSWRLCSPKWLGFSGLSLSL